MNAKDAAAEILKREGGGPLAVREIADQVIASGLVSLGGKTPRDTIAAQLYVEAKKPDGRFERTGRGMLRLRGSS